MRLVEASDAQEALTPEELTAAVRQIPQLAQRLEDVDATAEAASHTAADAAEAAREANNTSTRVENILIGTPVGDGTRVGGMVKAHDNLEGLIYKVVLAVLGANAFAGVVVYLAVR